MYCFYTTSQTKRLKKIVAFVFVCFCLMYTVYSTLFSCLICVCVYVYIYMIYIYIFIAHSISVDAMRIGRKAHEGIEDYQ